jgi:hypothetical protein
MNRAKEITALVEEEVFRLRNKGVGGFLNPPGHPEHDWSVVSKDSSTSLSSAIKSSYVDDAIKKQAQDLLNKWAGEKPPLSDPKIQDWIHQVMGYFHDMHKGHGDKETSWHASNLTHRPGADPMLNQDIHAGVNFIRKYYPEFKLEGGHVANAYWGSKK